MIIENLKYAVLSRDEEQAEVLPTVGDIFNLKVRKIQFQDRQDIDEVETATVTADLVRMLGPYSHIDGIGKTESMKEDLRCTVKYETTNVFPADTLIGELTFKRVVSEQ